MGRQMVYFKLWGRGKSKPWRGQKFNEFITLPLRGGRMTGSFQIEHDKKEGEGEAGTWGWG